LTLNQVTLLLLVSGPLVLDETPLELEETDEGDALYKKAPSPVDPITKSAMTTNILVVRFVVTSRPATEIKLSDSPPLSILARTSGSITDADGKSQLARGRQDLQVGLAAGQGSRPRRPPMARVGI